jgi:hypothetical protein
MNRWEYWANKLISKRKRKYGNNTWLYNVSGPEYPSKWSEVGDIGLRYHSTTIITWCRNGDILLNMNGWDTVSTRARLNEFDIDVSHLNGYCYVSWRTQYYYWEDGMTLCPDGRVLDAKGHLLHPVSPIVEARRQKRKARQYDRRRYGIQRKYNTFRSFCTNEIEWRFYDSGVWVHQCEENEKDHYAALGRKTKRCRACKVELPVQLQTLDKLQRAQGSTL